MCLRSCAYSSSFPTSVILYTTLKMSAEKGPDPPHGPQLSHEWILRLSCCWCRLFHMSSMLVQGRRLCSTREISPVRFLSLGASILISLMPMNHLACQTPLWRISQVSLARICMALSSLSHAPHDVQARPISIRSCCPPNVHLEPNNIVLGAK